MAIIVFFIVHWYLSLFFQSFFYHRYTAHRHFSMSQSTEKFFYFICFVVHGSSYMSPYAYGVLHRLHHMHTDTEQDPHSPSYHPGFLGTLWQTRNSYNKIYTGRTSADEKLTRDLPKWEAFDKIAHNWIARVVWIIVYVAIYSIFATAWWMFLLLPFTVIMCTLQGAIINYWAHTAAYTNYPMQNTSVNIIPVDFLFIGDAYHNNHHKFPGRANNAHRWFEFDPIYQTTCLLAKLKVVKWKASSFSNTD